MKKTIVLFLCLLTISMVSVPAEAATITVLSENYSIYGIVPACLFPPCGSTNQTSSSPVSYASQFLFLSASGGSTLSGGFLKASADLFLTGQATATATMDFRVSDPAKIDLEFLSSGHLLFISGVRLKNVTSNLALFQFGTNDARVSRSFTFLSNNTDTYRLTVDASTTGPSDWGGASVTFNVPELPTTWLLGIALGLLGFLHRKLNWLRNGQHASFGRMGVNGKY